MTPSVLRTFVTIHVLLATLHHNMLRIKAPLLTTKKHRLMTLTQQQPVHRIHIMPQTHSQPDQGERVVALLMVQLELSVPLSSSSDRPATPTVDVRVVQVKCKVVSIHEFEESILNVEPGYVEQEDGSGGCLIAVNVRFVVDGEFSLGQRVVQHESFHFLVGEMWKPAR